MPRALGAGFRALYRYLSRTFPCLISRPLCQIFTRFRQASTTYRNKRRDCIISLIQRYSDNDFRWSLTRKSLSQDFQIPSENRRMLYFWNIFRSGEQFFSFFSVDIKCFFGKSHVCSRRRNSGKAKSFPGDEFITTWGDAGFRSISGSKNKSNVFIKHRHCRGGWWVDVSTFQFC